MSYDRLLREIENLKRKVERLQTMDAPQAFNPAVLDDYLLEADAALLYLGKNDKAADSNRLNGQLASYYSPAHSHPYLGVNDKAQDSDKLDGLDSSDFVQIAGTQTITGRKTFSLHPILPSSMPTAATHAASKGYVDSVAGGPTWTAWIPSVIGWSSTNLTRSGHYKIIGDMLYWRVYISGTSNSTYAGFALPNSAKSIEASHAYWTGAFAAVDNKVILAAPGRWQIGSNATLVNFYKDFAASGWTASGIKTVVAQGIIGIQ